MNPDPDPTDNVRPPRPYGAGFYGERLYGLWPGTFVLVMPCTPAWVPKPLCGD